MNKYMKHGTTKNHQGYITLITILVIGVIGVTISLSLLMLGIGSGKSSVTSNHSLQARAAANSCIEEALMQIEDSTPYTGSGTLSLNNSTCNYIVANLGGQNRRIRSTAESGQITSRIEVNINNINPEINISSWREVADF